MTFIKIIFYIIKIRYKTKQRFGQIIYNCLDIDIKNDTLFYVHDGKVLFLLQSHVNLYKQLNKKD